MFVVKHAESACLTTCKNGTIGGIPMVYHTNVVKHAESCMFDYIGGIHNAMYTANGTKHHSKLQVAKLMKTAATKREVALLM